MTELDAVLGGYLKDALLALAASYVAVVTWVFKRQISRIDAMELSHRDYITRREFNETLASLKAELRESDKATQERLDTVINLLLQERRGQSG
jgi:two-component sensor histidine kinase